MNRREFLRLAGYGSLGAMILPSCGQGASGPMIPSRAPFGKPLNILILMTDEQRAVQHWPQSWADRNLKSLNRLRKHAEFHFRICQCLPMLAEPVDLSDLDLRSQEWDYVN
jgi:hypothetical protein